MNQVTETPRAYARGISQRPAERDPTEAGMLFLPRTDARGIPRRRIESR